MLKVIRRISERNPNYRTYETKRTICECEIANFWRSSTKSPWIPTSQEEQNKTFKKIGEMGTQLISKVLAMPQLIDVFIKPTELSVVRAGSYGWEDIEPQIIKAFKEVFEEQIVELFSIEPALMRVF